jgi:phospholipid transport system substrate-binding protein
MKEKAGFDGGRMNRRRLLGTAIAACVGVALLPRGAWAEDAGAAQFVQDFAARAVAMLGDHRLDRGERIQRFEALVREGFDLEAIAQLALGRYWRTARDDQRRTFTTLFERLLLASYARRLDEYNNQTLKVGNATPSGRDTMVASRLENGGQPLRIDWRVRRTDAGYRILDVVVEGVSLLVTHRNELASVIERSGGVDGLIEHLRQRVAAEEPAQSG